MNERRPPQDIAELDVIIEEDRRARETYKHERQVSAESEAFVIVRAIRNGLLRYDTRDLRSSYFVSPMRSIDDLAMRPTSLLQWLSTLEPVALDELSTIFDGLVAEMSVGGIGIVDEDRLEEAFAPIINASRQHLDEQLAREQALVQQRWGAGQVSEMSVAQGVSVVVTSDVAIYQLMEDLQRDLDETRLIVERQSRSKKLSADEKAELEAYRAKEKQRQLQIRRKTRSKAGKGKRKR